MSFLISRTEYKEQCLQTCGMLAWLSIVTVLDTPVHSRSKPVLVNNFDFGGLSMTTDLLFPVNKKYELQLSLKIEDESLNMKGFVVRRSENQLFYHYDLRFLEENPILNQWIRRQNQMMLRHRLKHAVGTRGYGLSLSNHIEDDRRFLNYWA